MAAAVPMAMLAWIVTPAVAGPAATDQRFTVTLIAALTGEVIWQCVLVVVLVAREQRSLRWPRFPSEPPGTQCGSHTGLPRSFRTRDLR
jgi:hypothetical protein